MVYVDETLRKHLENNQEIEAIVTFRGDYYTLEKALNDRDMQPNKSESIAIGVFSIIINKNQLYMLEHLEGIEAIEPDEDVTIF